MSYVARVKVAEKHEDLQGEVLAAYDRVAKARRFAPDHIVPIFAAMAHSSGVEQVAAVGQFIRESRTDIPLNELAICVTTNEAACHGNPEDEFVQHLRLAREAGLPEELLAKIGTAEIEQEPFPYGPVARFARLMARGEVVDDETFYLLRDKLGEAAVVHLLITVGYYLLVSRFIQQVWAPSAQRSA